MQVDPPSSEGPFSGGNSVDGEAGDKDTPSEAENAALPRFVAMLEPML